MDENQPEIVKRLRELGISVEPIHTLGKGKPDLLCGHRGKNYLLEIKNASKPKRDRELTADEAAWHSKWAGQIAIVETAEQAINVVIMGAK